MPATIPVPVHGNSRANRASIGFILTTASLPVRTRIRFTGSMEITFPEN